VFLAPGRSIRRARPARLDKGVGFWYPRKLKKASRRGGIAFLY
jgi:hypothetical protein